MLTRLSNKRHCQAYTEVAPAFITAYKGPWTSDSPFKASDDSTALDQIANPQDMSDERSRLSETDRTQIESSRVH